MRSTSISHRNAGSLRFATAVATMASLAVLAQAGAATAACNLIPTDPDRFQSVIGATNRPFVSPGETLEIAVQSRGCDARTAGLPGSDPDSYVASYIFPGSAGASAHMIVMAADCEQRTAALEACRQKPGMAKVECVSPHGPGPLRGIEMAQRDGVPVLSLRFPDTDSMAGSPADGQTLTGALTVAVTAKDAPLPCEPPPRRARTLPPRPG